VTPSGSLVRRAAIDALAQGLGLHRDPIPEPLEPTSWQTLLTLARRERLEGMLAQAVHRRWLAATETQAEELDALHADALELCLMLERTLLQVLDALDAAGVRALVLKGSAVAHLDYPDPSLRSFGDVDLLIHPTQLEAGIAVLDDRGYQRRYPEPRPGFDRRFGKAVTMSAAAGFEIDLHRTFALGPFGLTIDLEQLWTQPASYRLAGRPVGALATRHRFIHACYHAALGNAIPRLAALGDIAHLSRSDEVDPLEVLATVRAWRGEAVVARAVSLVGEILEVDVPGLTTWAAGYEPSGVERRALRAYGERASYAAKSYAALRVLPGFRARAAYAAALIMPRRSYLGDRHVGYASRLQRGLSQVRGRQHLL
jgi:hypothetical protein